MSGRRRCVLRAATLLSLLASAAIAGAATRSVVGTPGLSVKTVALTGGKLVITGTAASAGTIVKIQNTAFRDTADAQKAFSFEVDHRSPDCRVTLETGTGSLTLLISDCGPGVMPRGAWSSTTRFMIGDLAFHSGSTWRALRNNLGRRPDFNLLDWQLFAARGSVGPAGVRGERGAAGAIGATGPSGPSGATGSQGPQGAAGDQGPPGPQGPTGPQGEKGDPALVAGHVQQDTIGRSRPTKGILDLCKVQVTSTGKPLLTGGSVGVQPGEFELALHRDGVLLYRGYRDSSFTYYDMPGAGSHTYSLHLQTFGALGTYSCQVFALELNK